MTFKTHMIFNADADGFTTVCGINDGCSEAFSDQNPLVPFGWEKETTCKKCTAGYKKLVALEEKNEAEAAAYFASLPPQISREVQSDDTPF